MSSGHQLRDFVDVREVAGQLLTLAMHQDAAGVYNCGSGVPRSVLEIAEDTIGAHGGSIQLQRGVYPDRSDEPVAFWAEMQKFKTLQPDTRRHP